MKLLIIEDNQETVKGIQDYAEDVKWKYEECDFEHAYEKVAVFDPEIIVMDWMYDAEDIDRGASIFEQIYNKRFIPVIIFSAVASTIELPDYVKETPLIEIISKGDEQIVIDCIEKWSPYIKAVSELHEELNHSLVTSVQAIDNFMNMAEYPGEEVVKYMLNKRTTYYFDNDNIGEQPPAWVQYEYPPIQKTILVADILRCYSKDMDLNSPGKPEEYCVVLTPSCDMARAKSGTIILTADCLPASSFSQDAQLGRKDKKGEATYNKKKESLIKTLNAGYNAAKVALPMLPNKIPYMTIDLKKIKQLSLGGIAVSEKAINSKTEYIRIASVNSPFREQIVWAHMINSCRPGMPERNMDEWAQCMMEQ